jgi:5-oxopent-3-ene-1,2,5-tricarboxylate decarboxylase/2-hydroxyhepta-2,4-diene-1,7-dioate isomerase
VKRARVAYQGAVHSAVLASDEASLLLGNGETVRFDDVTWLPPLEPGTIFALGLNYRDHAAELSFKTPDKPLVFLKGPDALVGHNGASPCPTDVRQMHFECELAVVIGREARHVRGRHAYDIVAGYTIANDYALREYLEDFYRPNLRVKNRDHCTPIGPWIVDSSDIADPMVLDLRSYVNGELVQQGNTSEMIFSIPEIVEYLSDFMTLSPGDVILTGTPKGVRFVEPGDKVVTEIEGIGSLANTIVREVAMEEGAQVYAPSAHS